MCYRFGTLTALPDTKSGGFPASLFVKRGEFTMRKAAAIAASRIIDNMYEMVD